MVNGDDDDEQWALTYSVVLFMSPRPVHIFR